jgi:hypothetical protein
LNISLNKTMGERRGSNKRTGKEARPRAKATGILTANNKKKLPNRTRAAMEGVKREEVIQLTPG